MARLTVALAASVVVLAGLALAQAPDRELQQTQDFEKAGVCARCHVVQVIEWRISGHLKAGTDCQACHGTSLGHVRNERNEVKPDRVPREAAEVDKLCTNCHNAGCTKTREVTNCEKCHHVHALVNATTATIPRDERFEQLLTRWNSYRDKMEEGERLLQARNWTAARGAFTAALGLMAGSRDARNKLEICERRISPSLPGFEIIGGEFDSRTGLPKEVKVADLGIPMVLVPTGEADIGADNLSDSKPVHTVHVAAFYLGKFELTQAEWKFLMGTNPSAHQGESFPNVGSMPVEQVSWNDCQALIQKLNERVPGGGFRLPTEEEWEYAARAGSSEPFETEELPRFAWFVANSERSPGSGDASVDAYTPRPVGSKRPNQWGLYDMQGNVWEWTSSAFGPYLMPVEGGGSAATGGLRVLRGGGFADSAQVLDPALRHGERPGRRYRWNGLRLARSVPASPVAGR